jgi:hypothetical protein
MLGVERRADAADQVRKAAEAVDPAQQTIKTVDRGYQPFTA